MLSANNGGAASSQGNEQEQGMPMQAAQAPYVGPEQADAQFRDGFTQQAYATLEQKHPELLEGIGGFNIIKTEPESGFGIGVFLLNTGASTAMIPAVMVDSQIKPFDFFYSKDQGEFLPLNESWLNETQKKTMPTMGEGTRYPTTLSPDVNIRNLVLPPVTGRYSFASDKGEFPKALAKAPDVIKKAFLEFLHDHKELTKAAAEIYGVERLTKAFKRAEEEPVKMQGGALQIANEGTLGPAFREAFGPQAAEAYEKVLEDGYAFKDTRQNPDRAVLPQSTVKLEKITASGAYRMYTTEGGLLRALVVSQPVNFFGCDSREADKWPIGSTTRRLLFFFEDGSYLMLNSGTTGSSEYRDSPMGEPIDASELAGTVLSFSDKREVPSFSIGKEGSLLRKRGTGYEATVPFRVKGVRTENGATIVNIEDSQFESGLDPQKKLIVDPHAGSDAIRGGPASSVYYAPPTFKFFPTGNMRDYREFLCSSNEFTDRLLSEIYKLGGNPVIVKSAGEGLYNINDSWETLTTAKALEKLAVEQNLFAGDAERILRHVTPWDPVFRFYKISTAKLLKVAKETGVKVAQEGAPPPKKEKKEPAGTEDPMAAPQPPPLDPMTAAINEAQAQIRGQVEKAMEIGNVLQQVQMRASQLSGGGAGTPPGIDMTGGMMPMDPSMQGMGGMPMDPSQGGMMDPSMQGMSGMDPSMQGGMPPGMMPMDPSMQGMGGMDPSMGGMGGMMDPSMQLEQAYPAMDSAMQTGIPEAFDATAIGAIVNSPSLKDLTKEYLPVLRQSLDYLHRILLSLWVSSEELQSELGIETFDVLEENLQNVVKYLGNLVLQLSQNSSTLPDAHDPKNVDQ